MIESSYSPRKRSVHNFGNELRMIVLGWYPFLKSLMPLYKSMILLILLLVSSSSILAVRYSFFFFLKCLIASRLTLFRLSTLFRLGSCVHCILGCFVWSKKTKHSVTNHGFAHIKLFCLSYKMTLFNFECHQNTELNRRAAKLQHSAVTKSALWLWLHCNWQRQLCAENSGKNWNCQFWRVKVGVRKFCNFGNDGRVGWGGRGGRGMLI